MPEFVTGMQVVGPTIDFNTVVQAYWADNPASTAEFLVVHPDTGAVIGAGITDEEAGAAAYANDPSVGGIIIYIHYKYPLSEGGFIVSPRLIEVTPNPNTLS